MVYCGKQIHEDRTAESRFCALLLTFFVLSGFLLRLYRLSSNSLWLDEACTHTFSQETFMGIWQTISSEGEVHPPTFYWLEHIMLFWGDSEFVLRFIPAVAGVLTIPIFYLIGIEFRDRYTGLLSAALLSFSPFHIYYSQDARSYTLFLLFFSIAFLLYLKILKSNNVKEWVLFGVFSAITFWTHYYAFIPIGLLYLHSLIITLRKMKEDVKSIKYIGISIFIFILLSLPLVFIAINMFFVRTSVAPTWGMNGVRIITQTLKQFSGYNQMDMGIFVLLFYIGIVPTIISDKNKSLLLVYLMFLSMFVSYVLSTKMPMMPRYLIFLLPIFYLGIASSYTAFYSIIKNSKIIYLLIIFIIMSNLPFLLNYYSGFQKEDWRGFSKDLQKMTNKDDIIVVLPGYITQPLNYYYDNKSDQTYEYEASSSSQLQQIFSQNKGHQIFYVITADINAANPEGDAINWLENKTKFVKKHTNIFLWRTR